MANLRIEPSDHQVHFCLTDETPEFDITLTQVDQRGPLIYRVQPTLKNRYAIWPSVGVVQPGSYAIVSIVLLERARFELENSFGKVDWSSTDRIVVEWCRAPESVYRRLGLMGDSDQDFEILSSFWNTKGYEFSTPVMTARQPLSVRYSIGPSQGFSVEFTNHDDTFIPNTESMILPSVSLDTSTTQADPSLLGDESFAMSVGTAEDEDGREYSTTRDSRGNFIIKSKPSTSSANTTASTRSSSTATLPKNTIHKFQLQQTLRCTGCYQVFSRDPDSFAIPVMSQACGHSICRGCVVRQADEDFAFTQTYADAICCPICQIPDAFSQELHINHSLCAIIALIDS